MKAFTINRYSKKSLTTVDLPEPIIKENEVLVEIHSASVNQLDAKIKTGEFKLYFLINSFDFRTRCCRNITKIGSKSVDLKSAMRFLPDLPILKLAHLQNILP
jgi:hypothetical protein